MEQQSRKPPPPRRRGRRPRAVSPMVAGLRRRFEQFRAQHPRGTRVPPELRAAVLSALARGAVPADIARACGVSWSQIRAWEGRRRESSTAAAEDLRVFSVVDTPPDARDAPNAAAAAGDHLELRLGQWSVSIKLAERD